MPSSYVQEHVHAHGYPARASKTLRMRMARIPVGQDGVNVLNPRVRGF